MKHHYKRFFLLQATALFLLSGCATYHLRQGNRLFNSLAYTDAIVEYQKALGKKDLPQAQIQLAESYRLTNNTVKAEDAYSKVVQLKECEPVHKLRYAQLLMRNGKYDMAKTWYDNYLKDQPNDTNAKQLRASCDSIQTMKKDSAIYTVTSIGVNTGQSNFSPQYYKDGIVFASDRSSGKSGKVSTYPWTGQPYLDLFYSKGDSKGNFSAPEALRGDVNGIYHDGPCVFSGDSVMYFTRDNYIKKKAKKGDAGVVNLKIYKATKKDSLWKNVEELPFNSNNYSTGHPALTKDGNTMYFVSDMPGGLGGTDLYVSKKENGKWGAPKNMGPSINTSLNEMFPTVFHDSILYFSSEGHTNMGGLDLFYSQNENGKWSDAVNMRYPINSSYDDFGVILNDSATEGYFSSNRNSNTTQDNIFGFTKLFFTLEGIAVEKISQQPLGGVLVELTNETTGKKLATITGDDGKFMFMLEQNSDFSVVGSKDNYFTNTERVTTKNKIRSENMYVKLKLEMERIIVNKAIALENIYYDLDKWDIRPDAAAGLDKLVSVLKENSDIKIELGSHTDSRADDAYNMRLSQKRAESAVSYLVSHGITKDRMTAKGFGESMLVNRCKNGVECTEEEHQQNRRTEFKVVGFTSNDKK
ncbi:MAG: OmpA family protein [Bacteroidetes bacterium]|nr:OmpA family protein [Bacteroidota bacterium]